jgi:hypothetical protein
MLDNAETALKVSNIRMQSDLASLVRKALWRSVSSNNEPYQDRDQRLW